MNHLSFIRVAKAVRTVAEQMDRELRIDVAQAQRARGLVAEWEAAAQQKVIGWEHYERFANELRSELEKQPPWPELPK